MKEKYEMQSKSFKNIGQRAREQTERSNKKDVSTGKYVINEYLLDTFEDMYYYTYLRLWYLYGNSIAV